MDNRYNKIGMFSSSTLKIIACIFMTVDHVGLVLFPSYEIFRILGRLAFPMFAFFIAEGSRYSRHKLRRFLTIFSIGIALFVFYYFFDGTLYGNIFLTFSLSILVDHMIFMCKKAFTVADSAYTNKLIILCAVAVIVVLYWIYALIHFEYGFFGMLLPAIINLTNFRDIDINGILKRLDCHFMRILLLTLGLIPLSINGNLGDIQFYCFFAVIPLIFYNGAVGCKKLKYAFYIFYPAHLLIIEGIAFLISAFNK